MGTVAAWIVISVVLTVFDWPSLPTLILNIYSANISFPLGKMIGTVRS